MQKYPSLLIVSLLTIGCDTLFQSTQVGNPVMGPPPQRVGVLPSQQRAQEPTGTAFIENTYPALSTGHTVGENPGVRAVDHHLLDPAEVDLSGSQVVAVVNGEPIFAYDLLKGISFQLEKIRQQAPPEAYLKIRNEQIKRGLKTNIERKLLTEALRNSLEKKQLEQLNEHLKLMFGEFTKELMEKYEVSNKQDLVEKMKAENASFSALKDSFINNRMAAQYVNLKAQPELRFGREDLLQYYEQHRQDYEIIPQVEWKQIVIKYVEYGGREKAFQALQRAIYELKQNADFEEVAGLFSNGPTAQQGGARGWLKPGDLRTDLSELEKTLFSIPVGTISQPIEVPDAYHLVLVTQRKEAGYVPFEEVQDKIRELLQANAQEQAVREVIDQLFKQAIIETDFEIF